MTEQRSTTVVLADDHEFLRDGLKLMIKKLKDVRLVSEAANGQELLEAVTRLKPAIVITDIKMPLIDGIEATKIIKEKFPQIKVIALSNYDEHGLIADALYAGADAYLLKNSTKRNMEEAIASVLNGKPYYCSATSKKILDNIANKKPIITGRERKIHFTTREKEVLKLVCKGMTNKQIGNQLQISARTVESHRVSIQEKTGLRSAASLAIFAVKFGHL
jgi:DNA-binding NarL/FixJ family response regulator